jgi:hypothetical protein
MTSAYTCGMSRETGLARSFSDDRPRATSSFNKPAPPLSCGIPPFLTTEPAASVTANSLAMGPGFAKRQSFMGSLVCGGKPIRLFVIRPGSSSVHGSPTRSLRRYVAAPPRRSFPSQLLDLAFFTLSPANLPPRNPLIARVCTPLHVNEKKFFCVPSFLLGAPCSVLCELRAPHRRVPSLTGRAALPRGLGPPITKPLLYRAFSLCPAKRSFFGEWKAHAPKIAVANQGAGKKCMPQRTVQL